MIKRFAVVLVLSTLAFAPSAVVAATAAPGKIATTSAGKVLVDAQGMALYTYEKDTAGKSTCTGGCADAWPPMAAPAGAKASGRWSVINRADGTKVWGYQGHALYTFASDKPGDVTGDGVEGFHVVK